MRNADKKFLSEDLTVRGHSEDLGVDWEMIIKWIFEKQGGKLWIGFIWLRIGTSSGPS
jgi:hypothetical protein